MNYELRVNRKGLSVLCGLRGEQVVKAREEIVTSVTDFWIISPMHRNSPLEIDNKNQTIQKKVLSNEYRKAYMVSMLIYYVK
jgi:capsid protein